MFTPRPQQRAYVLALVDAFLLCLAFALAFIVRIHFPPPPLEPIRPDFASHFWLLALAIPLFWALTHRRRIPEIPRTLSSALLSVGVPFIYLGLFLGTAIFLFQAKDFSRAVFFLFLAIAFVMLVTTRVVCSVFRLTAGRADQWQKRILIVGASPEALDLGRKIENNADYNAHVVGYLVDPQGHDSPPDSESWTGPLGSLEDLPAIVEKSIVDDVVFAISPAELPSYEKYITWCEELGITAHLKIDIVRSLISKTHATDLDGTPVLTVVTTPDDAAALLAKRTIDIVVSSLALIILAPLMLLIALAIKLTSPGPAIFSQERVGLNGRIFRFFKFRSMYKDAETHRTRLEELNEVDGPVFKIRSDPRVTPIGRWLRKYSIDELPQFMNVLRGEMSLVGPRPPLPDEVKKYERWQRRRLSMKPGLTCLWQVKGRSELPFLEWMRLDLQYIDNWSLSLDLKILLRTIPAVVTARGAQ